MKIAAGKFKAECLQLMDYVNSTHEEIIVTKRGKPVVRIMPISKEPKAGLFGYLRNSVIEHDNIIKSIDIEWNAEK